MWVAGHLTGGLGNRLFQHAAAAGLAEKTGRQLVFHLPSCAPTGHGPFDTIFRLFPDVPVIQDECPTLMVSEPHGGVFTYHPFPAFEGVSQNIVIDGWRQTPLYFPTHAIHAHLEAALPGNTAAYLLQKCRLDTTEAKLRTWFIHIRLGDYMILPHHQINIGAYYAEAIKYIPKDANILIFSDQARDYKDMFTAMFEKLGHKVNVVTDVTDELETLFLMSQCWGGSIVANSTFSWWGAYFAHQRCLKPESYKAIYPTCWGQGLPEARDIIPSWGIRVKTSG